jgi:branched-chain amino acid transport system substrate-binding protein
LPDAQKDVELIKRLLKQPRFQFESVQCLCDRPLQEMQETIELFFKQRRSDDQLVFLFCGYLLPDADGKLYFATPSTKLDDQGAIVKAQTIPASAVLESMNSSPAKQQVFILNRYSPPLLDQSAVAEPMSDLTAPFGGAGRVILAASNVSRPALTPEALDVWTYPRYLAEGIESSAADADDDGIVTAADLHHYAAQKLQVAAPTLQPQLHGSAETAQMPLLEVPNNDPRLHYRKVLETASIAIDVSGAPVLEGLPLLEEMRQRLGVSPQEAEALEAQVLRPTREYRQRVTLYQEQVAEHARSHATDHPQVRQTLKQLQHALYLNDRDVAVMTIAPSLVEHQRQKALYQQVLLWAMQRQSPLGEGDRTMLQRLQQTLHLGDDDTRTIEAQITTQTEQFVADLSEKPESETANTPDAGATSQSSPVSPAPKAFSSSPPPSAAPLPTAVPPSHDDSRASHDDSRASHDDSRAKEAVLQRLFNMNEPVTSPLEPASLAETPLNPVPVREEPLPILPDAKPNLMDRVRRSASNYQALIIPAILLAAIIGLVAAILPSSSRPGWLKFGQTPADPAAAQRLNSEGRRKAQAGDNKAAIADYDQAIEKNPNDVSAYINRGVAHHRLGDTGAAIRDYEQALKLDPKSAVLYSNLSYAYYDRQNYDKALETGNQAVALNGSSAEAHINLANARSKKGDYDSAMRDYAQAIALKPPAPILAGAYNNRGNAQLALNNTRAAIGDYNRAIRRKPDYADAYYNLGLAQQALGNRSGAISNLQKAADLYKAQGKEALQKEAIDRVNGLQQSNV